MTMLEDLLEKKSISFSAGGIDFRLEEFTRAEQRRYYRQIVQLTEKVKQVALGQVVQDQVDLVAISEAVLDADNDAIVWILQLGTSFPITADWVEENLTGGQIAKIFSLIDQLNGTEGHMGNVLQRVVQAQTALKLIPGSQSSSSSLPATDASPTN